MNVSYFLRIFKKKVIAIPIEAPSANHCNQLILEEFSSTGALIATGFSYDVADRAGQAKLVSKLLLEIRDLRRIGAGAADLCLVATGRLDAFYEMGLNEWDLAAGGLIATEAGALVTGRNGGPAGKEMVIAAGPHLHARLVSEIG